MDYDTIMDDETKAFIATSTSFYPEHREELGLDHQRQFFINLCRYFDKPHPDAMIITDNDIDGVPTRSYRMSADATAHVVYFHGGGFVAGNLDTHNTVCMGIAEDAGVDVTAVDYRLAPEHVAPAAFDDCRRVTAHILRNTDKPVIVAGDSAGGYLAAMVALEFGAQLAGQVLIYPMLGARMDHGSYLAAANAPMLNTDQVQYYWQVYLDRVVARDEELLPMTAPVDAALPPAMIIGAECDPLFSDAPQYAEKLNAAGVKATLHIAHGLPHGFLRARHTVTRAAEAFRHITTGITTLAQS